jgi:IS5 family transposase
MFKILILQQLYNISDEALEYQVKDRLSFMEFLNLGLGHLEKYQKSLSHSKTQSRT